MRPARDAVAPAGTEANHGSSKSTPTITQLPAARKWQRFLTALLESPRTSRELELAPVFDHCAHSTAAELRKKGIDLVAEIIEISGYHGQPARIARYSIAPESVERARRLLGRRS